MAKSRRAAPDTKPSPTPKVDPAPESADARQEAIRRLLSAHRTEGVAAITLDPHWKPKPRQGLIRVEVTKNMTFLDGRFHNAGAQLAAPQHEAEAAVAEGAARWLEAAGTTEASDA